MEDVRLREMDYGKQNAQSIEEKAITKSHIADKGGPFFYRYDGGESYSDVINRCSTLYNQLMNQWAERIWGDYIVILVCHAHVK